MKMEMGANFTDVDTYAISHGSWAMQKGTKTSECYIARVADECDIAFHEFWYFCIATEP